jgi:GNAT superfamily N-acetyltransferase
VQARCLRSQGGAVRGFETQGYCMSKNLIIRPAIPTDVRVLIAEYQGEPAGFALFFLNFSTFLAKPGIFLEDLFVRPAVRGKGIGKALLKELVKTAAQEGYGRVEWAVLDWNTQAIDFYRSLGASPMSDWTIFRLNSAAINSLARDDKN